jgi:hypothetical protein
MSLLKLNAGAEAGNPSGASAIEDLTSENLDQTILNLWQPCLTKGPAIMRFFWSRTIIERAIRSRARAYR